MLCILGIKFEISCLVIVLLTFCHYPREEVINICIEDLLYETYILYRNCTNLYAFKKLDCLIKISREENCSLLFLNVERKNCNLRFELTRVKVK